jgi:hypothetical protein
MDGTRLLKGDHAKQPLSLRDVVNKIIHGAPAYVMVRDGVMELNLHGETTTQPGEIELMLQLSDVARHDRSRSAGNGFELPLIGMCGKSAGRAGEPGSPRRERGTRGQCVMARAINEPWRPGGN